MSAIRLFVNNMCDERQKAVIDRLLRLGTPDSVQKEITEQLMFRLELFETGILTAALPNQLIIEYVKPFIPT